MPKNNIMKHFVFDHLPAKLQAISLPVCNTALTMDRCLKDCDEKSAGMRKLLEAKDCFVRSALEESKNA